MNKDEKLLEAEKKVEKAQKDFNNAVSQLGYDQALLEAKKDYVRVKRNLTNGH